MPKYKFVYVNGKVKRLHRFVLEQYLGRELEPDECCHHLNGNPLDNRLENLELMLKSEHTRLHHKGKKLSDETKRKMSIKAKQRGSEYWKKWRKLRKGHEVSLSTRLKISQSLRRLNYDKIFELRQKGLTQKQIAEIMQCNQATISKILGGKKGCLFILTNVKNVAQ